MQLSVHIFMTVSSQAPNQSAWKELPGRIMGAFAMMSDDRCHVGRELSQVPERSRSASVVYHTPIVKVGMT